jgi:hypothetical protein
VLWAKGIKIYPENKIFVAWNKEKVAFYVFGDNTITKEK